MTTLRSVVFVLLVAGGTSPVELAAEPYDDHPLVLDADMTLADVVMATARVDGDGEARAAAYAEADALERRADLLFAQAPQISIRHNRDGPGEQTGLVENEVLFQVALKRPGQSRIQAEFAAAARTLAGTEGRERVWRLAGIARDLVWQHRSARVGVEAAQLALESAREIARMLELRHAAGDLSTTDVLAARTEVLARERELEDAFATLADAERAYMRWTGLARIPVDATESLVVRNEGDHPALAAAADAVRRAESSVAVQREAARTAPTIAIGPRRERGTRASARADSVTLMVNIPFGTEAYADPQIASARRAVTDAELDYRRRVREVDMALHEAEHELRLVRNLERNRARVRTLTAERARIARIALDDGELSVTEFLRVQSDADRARLASELNKIHIARAVARVNQARGVLPHGALREDERGSRP